MKSVYIDGLKARALAHFVVRTVALNVLARSAEYRELMVEQSQDFHPDDNQDRDKQQLDTVTNPP